MPSQPKMFNVGIGFDRSNDYGIKQMPSTENHMEDESEQEESSLSNSVNYVPLHKANHPLHMPFESLSNEHFSTSASHINIGSNNDLSKSAAKFSIGTGVINNGFNYLRECDSESSIDLIASRSNKSDSILCNNVSFIIIF